MTQYIDKDDLISKIKDLKLKLNWVLEDFSEAKEIAYDNVLDVIYGSEVKKEVDLEKSARNYLLHEHLSPLNNILHQADLKTEFQYHKDIETAFKAGFELGLKAQKGE